MIEDEDEDKEHGIDQELDSALAELLLFRRQQMPGRRFYEDTRLQLL